MQARSSRPASAGIETSHVTCPFCGLLCDDIRLSRTDGQIQVEANGCDKSRAGFERPPIDTAPRIDGENTTLEAAVAHAARLLKASRQPLFAGLGVDVSGMRGVMDLADRTGATLDHMLGEGLMRNFLTLQDRGWMMTTLTEIRNRADLIVFAGTDATAFPRFFERYVWNADSMFDTKTEAREIVYLGRKLDTRPGRSPGGRKPIEIKCDNNRIGEVVSAIRALAAGKTLRARSVAGARVKDLQQLAQKMQQASYGVLVWAPADLAFPHADLAVQSFAELVKDLNETTRFGGFTLGGDEGALSAAQVCAWQSGFPLRTSFAQGRPAYDHSRFSTARMLGDGEADSLLWLSTFNPQRLPPATDIATIVIGHPHMEFRQEPAVFIPAGTPGIDHAGQHIRCDTVVSLRLRALRPAQAPSAAEILEQIQNSL